MTTTATRVSDTTRHNQPNAATLHVHVLPPRVLLSSFAALLMLTVLTVAVTTIDTGAFEIWISLGIAALKASIVALYFMHLRYDKSFNSVVFVAAIVCLALFLILTLADVDAYQTEIQLPESPATQMQDG